MLSLVFRLKFFDLIYEMHLIYILLLISIQWFEIVTIILVEVFPWPQKCFPFSSMYLRNAGQVLKVGVFLIRQVVVIDFDTLNNLSISGDELYLTSYSALVESIYGQTPNTRLVLIY